MEVNVLNIKGEDTGRKVTLNESIFGIEPNDHAIYLDVKQFMANPVSYTHLDVYKRQVLPVPLWELQVSCLLHHSRKQRKF